MIESEANAFFKCTIIENEVRIISVPYFKFPKIRNIGVLPSENLQALLQIGFHCNFDFNEAFRNKISTWLSGD